MVIDFSQDPPDQVDFLTVLKKEKSMQLDIHRLKDPEVTDKANSPQKKPGKKQDKTSG
jgi:hypothetical protein